MVEGGFGLGMYVGLGFTTGAGFGLPREPPGEAAGAPGVAAPAGPLAGTCPGAFQESVARTNALKKRERDVFIRSMGSIQMD